MVKVRSVHPSTVLGLYEVIIPSDFRDHGMPAVPKIPWGAFQGEVAVEVEPNPAKAGQGQATAYTGSWLASGTAKFRAAQAAGVVPELARSWSVERFLRGLRYDLFPAPATTGPSPTLDVGGGEPAPARWVSPQWLAEFASLAQVLGGFELTPSPAEPPASAKIRVARVRELVGWILPAWATALAGAETLDQSGLHSVFQSLDWEIQGSFSQEALAAAPMSVPGSSDPATDPRAQFFRARRFPGFSPAPPSKQRSAGAGVAPPAAGGFGLFGATPGAAAAAAAEAAAAAARVAAAAAATRSQTRDPRLGAAQFAASVSPGGGFFGHVPPPAQFQPPPPGPNPRPWAGSTLPTLQPCRRRSRRCRHCRRSSRRRRRHGRACRQACRRPARAAATRVAGGGCTQHCPSMALPCRVGTAYSRVTRGGCTPALATTPAPPCQAQPYLTFKATTMDSLAGTRRPGLRLRQTRKGLARARRPQGRRLTTTPALSM